MFDQSFALLLFLGVFFKVAGLAVRDELAVRILLLIGFACDLAYFIQISPMIPGAAFAYGALVLVNLGVVLMLFWDRSTLFMSKNERAAFAYFNTLTPGQFRKVIRKARWTVAPVDTVLLTEDEHTDKLFYLETNDFSLTKQGTTYQTAGPAFLGEIMLLQGGTSSATVTVPKGAIYAQWQAAELKSMMAASRPLKNALVARFGHDLADKLRNSVPIQDPA